MANLKLRRLTDIRTKHVSLVDFAANMRKFLIVKRKDEGENSMEIQDVLKKVEDALNSFANKQDEFEKQLNKIEESGADALITFDMDKKGARLSKETRGKLASLRDTLSKLLKENDEDEDEKTEKALTPEAIDAAVKKGALEGLKKDEESGDVDAEMIKKIAEIIKAVNDK